MYNQPASYRLICIDVDGTLLDSRHELAPGVVEALDALRERGVLPVLASGRTRIGVDPLLQRLNLGPAHIGGNGSYACGLDGEVLFTRPIPPDVLPTLLNRARHENLGPALHGIDATLLEGSAEHEQVLKNHNAGLARRVPDVLAAGMDCPLKVTLWGPAPALEHFARWARVEQLPVEMIFSTAHFLEFNGLGVNKGAGVKTFAEALGIPLERTMVVGDQFNDISMFSVAGLAVAMGNAPLDVQRAAHHVAPTNDAGGLSWAIHRYVLS